ncbi:hypothetical protein BU16DRAFT_542698 [Lophium mytilinum]|uniref:Lysine-specific metallo-endopeptidase domain-containing protein n=1 Tax=Lophium mytilinum TaxID=390894 RepID=A0A6A6QIV5_9PEZI|nr:hypothetical protein BU16DRAFT_542698 [Lophium mytilinum]
MRRSLLFYPLSLLVVSAYAGFGVFEECFNILDAKESDGGCRDHKARLTTAWKDACDAISAANDAINFMRSAANTETEKPANWAQEQLRINPMSAAMFGSRFDDRGVFDSMTRLSVIDTNLFSLMHACDGSIGKWSIYCTDADWEWLKETREDPEQPGKKISETQSTMCGSGGVWYSKNRVGTESHYREGPPPKKVLGVSSKKGPICGFDKDYMAETDMSLGIITLCKAGLDQVVDIKAQEIYADKKKPFSSQTKSSDLDKTGGMAITLIHEMLHMVGALKDQAIYDDAGNKITQRVTMWNTKTNKYEETNTDVLAYGYANCVDLAKRKPDLAPRNPDSFSFFAIAMYLKDWDWSHGYAQRLA